MYDLNSPYYKDVRRQWENLISGKPLQEELIRPEVLDIWKELHADGIDPYNYTVHVIPQNEFESRLLDNQLMIEVSMPFLSNLYENIPFSYSIFTLSDKDGVPLTGFAVTENPEYSVYLEDNKLIEGIAPECMLACASEIIMCIRSKKTAWCCADENYLASSKNWSCIAAPILDAEENVIGVLSISDKNQQSSAHSMGIVTSAARAISNEMQMFTANEQLRKTSQQLRSIIESTPLGILFVDGDGIIQHANRKISDMLYLSSTPAPLSNLEGEHISHILVDENGLFSDWNPENISEQEILLKTPRGFHRYYISIKTENSTNNPANNWALITLKEMEYIRKFARNLSSSHAKFQFSDIIGDSEKFAMQLHLAEIAAKSSSTVLITGPSGTGKELFAQAIHSASDRASGPFITINCGALPSGLVESELFGYEGGSFTGAKKNGQVGKFELANNGTLFLDEIGEMPLSVQASILRVLQTGEVTRIGGTKTNYVDVRIIAATNRNLTNAVKEKQFREDLYYRLNVLRLTIPPLCERKDDIRPLANQFLSSYCEQLHKNHVQITDDAFACLTSYDWPGNVRELENIIERAVNITDSNTNITGDLIRLFIPVEEPLSKTSTIPDPSFTQIKSVERDLILQALVNNHGSITKAAQSIGIGRRTLYRKCDEYGINYNKYRK